VTPHTFRATRQIQRRGNGHEASSEGSANPEISPAPAPPAWWTFSPLNVGGCPNHAGRASAGTRGLVQRLTPDHLAPLAIQACHTASPTRPAPCASLIRGRATSVRLRSTQQGSHQVCRRAPLWSAAIRRPGGCTSAPCAWPLPAPTATLRGRDDERAVLGRLLELLVQKTHASGTDWAAAHLRTRCERPSAALADCSICDGAGNSRPRQDSDRLRMSSSGSASSGQNLQSEIGPYSE
jgi:hypothetical protein